ncbi:hypothetical protein ACH4CE_00150 [Streptomyces gelaticus]|uniref:hypothetical protein n=1 Tax=Streptomyces gelaticus TaxID=285446 RepID=UPI0037AB3963
MPSVGRLSLRPGTDMLGLEEIPRVFPALKWMTLSPPTHVRHVDLSPLQAMPGCRVAVTGHASVVGGEGHDLYR